MNILVAGATGKTGIRVTEQLREQGHTPIALVRDSSDTSALASDVVLRKGDLTNLTALLPRNPLHLVLLPSCRMVCPV